MWQFLVAGGPFMFFLVATSIVSVAFMIERGLALRRQKVVPKNIEDAIEKCETKEDLQNLKLLCQREDSCLGRVTLGAIEHLSWPKPDNVDAVETRARNEIVALERGLVVLEVIVGIAPLLGLVGTIHGLITLFSDIGHSGLADHATVARGIAIALNTTLMGLLIAIPTLVAWSYYTNKVESMAVEMETLMDDFLRRQYRRKAHPPAQSAAK
ncbi:MAG: MotA/TolQ/ExbB proton channel family protein [Verrucomicrobiae bacterium]|nr:MotA/TolQ/ExbB proton channel family protein [Verrucomicrobiae bacterium]